MIPADKPCTLALAEAKPRGCLPWHRALYAPVIPSIRAVAMALTCGNTVVLYASKLCPRTHQLIGGCLVAATEVRDVNFVGSTGVGRIIGLVEGKNLKPALLELGGKAPLLVMEDADLEGAVNAAFFDALMVQIKICMSTVRIILDNAISVAFVARLAARASALPHGNPRDKLLLGSLVTTAAAENMDA